MQEQFVSINMSQRSLAVVAAAIRICEDYSAQGYKLTLRQLYYQFVARQPLPYQWENSEKNYKKLSGIISDARLTGLIDWDMIEDRGRTVSTNPHWDSPRDILETCASQFKIDLWADQPEFCFVLVEKQALEGVLEPVCRGLDIPFSANKGYSSQSALYEIGQTMRRMIQLEKQVHVLYLGDHDPSGIDMTRDVTERLRMFARAENDQLQVHRLALNMDQVERYRPPENPAKVTDSRYMKYRREFGPSSWELDALEPTVLADLVRTFVHGHIDNDKMTVAVRKQTDWRRDIKQIAEETSW